MGCVKRYHFAAAMKAGKFFALEIEYATTTPSWVNHPADAHRIHPHNTEGGLREPEYYFENSDRMKEWLKGSKMVWITLLCDAEITWP